MTKLNRGLIVSCQAAKGEPLHNLGIMKYFARAAVLGGAVGIRCACDDVAAIREEVDVPIIALIKKYYDDCEVFITPTVLEVDKLLHSGCDVIALDATIRTRPNGKNLMQMVRYIRETAPNIEIMADIATMDEAKNAEQLGFDYVGCTLRGYTKETQGLSIPDIGFVEKFVAQIKSSKTIIEGGIWEKNQLDVVSCFNPYAVVIGTSITRPMDITKRFVAGLQLR